MSNLVSSIEQRCAPLGPNRDPDSSSIDDTAQETPKLLRRGQLGVLESAQCPGTTDEAVHSFLATSGLISPNDPKTKAFPFMPFDWPGLAGHCIRLDRFQLPWESIRAWRKGRLIELAGEIKTRIIGMIDTRNIVAWLLAFRSAPFELRKA